MQTIRRTSHLSARVFTTAVACLVLCAAATACVLAAAEPAQESGRTSVGKGVYTERQAARGKKAYEDECAQCHPVGEAGDGAAPSLVGPAFRARWSEQTVGDIFVATRTTMPQAAPASLSKEAYLDIVAYLLHANNYPAGDTELPSNLETLLTIVINKERAQ